MCSKTQRWKELSLGAALLLALALTMAPKPADAINVKAGMVAPDFTVQTLYGEEVSLHDFRGRIVMVTFWSSWCARCKEEMEFLEGMKAKYPSLNLIALNSETDNPQPEDIAKMKEALKEWKMPLIVALDEGLKVWDLYKVNALPTSMIVGTDGTILFIESNYYWASPDKIEATLQAAFGTPAQ